MALNDTTVRQARPKPKAYKLADGRGLLLLVQPNGAKLWRLRYRFARKEQMLLTRSLPRGLLIYGTGAS